VELFNGAIKLVELQSQPVGNLDPIQLQIAIQDCFQRFPTAAPVVTNFGISIAITTLLFDVVEATTINIPKSPTDVSVMVNIMMIPPFVQAYLDNFPFGNFTPLNSKLLTPAVIVSAQLDFICVTAALYALLSMMLLYLFMRPPAQPLTIQSILDATWIVPGTPDVLRGHAVAAAVEQTAIQGYDRYDAKKEEHSPPYQHSISQPLTFSLLRPGMESSSLSGDDWIEREPAFGSQQNFNKQIARTRCILCGVDGKNQYFLQNLLCCCPAHAVVAQGAITLLTIPAFIDEQIAIPPLGFDVPLFVPWSADETLAPFNAGKFGNGKLATNFVYVEQILGFTLSDTLPPGYIIPM
jgi:hypothetical protein